MSICVLNRHQAEQFEFRGIIPDCRCHPHKRYGVALAMVEAGNYRWCSATGSNSRRRITSISVTRRSRSAISARESELNAEYYRGHSDAAVARAKVEVWPFTGEALRYVSPLRPNTNDASSFSLFGLPGGKEKFMKNWYDNPAELVRRRKAVGLTQAQLGERSKVPRATIAGIEAEQQAFTADVRDRLWKAIAKVEIERSKMTKLRDLLPPKDPAAFKRWQEKMFKPIQPTTELLLAVNRAIGNYVGHLRGKGELSEDAARVVFERLGERIDNNTKDAHSLRDIGGGLGWVLASLEAGLLRQDTRVAELEARIAQLEAQPAEAVR